MNVTKKALSKAGLALLIAVLLLAGATFAWFTDSVTSGGNKIQAGTLDVTLEELGDDGNFIAVGNEPIFDSVLWEPGYSEYSVLRVANKGSLALKWRLDLRASGDAGKLGDVIDVYVKLSKTAITDKPANFADAQAEGYVLAGTLSDLASDPDGAAYGVLYSADDKAKPANGVSEAYAGIVLHMKENAGNEYQGEGIGTSFDIRLTATQYAYEKDGFDNEQYDADAEYGVGAGSASELNNLLDTIKDGDRIILTDNITSDQNTDIVRVKDVVIDFAGKVAYIDNNNISIRVGGNATNRASATLKNGTIIAGQGTYCTVSANEGELVLDNMILKNSTANGNSVKATTNGVITLNNVNSSSTHGGGMEAAGGTINVNGGTFTQSGFHNWNSVLGAASGGTGVLNIRDMTGTSENYGLYIFSSGGKINVYSGNFTAGKEILRADAAGAINIYGGSFDGRIGAIHADCDLNIKAGTFKNTGLTKEQFSQYVAEGSSLIVEGDTFVVTA